MAHTATAPRFHGKSSDRDDDRFLVDEPVQRRIYGGFHFGSSFFGWLIAVGVSVIITTILTAIGGAVITGTVENVTPDGVASSAGTIGVVGGLFLLLTMAVAYYTGGYVAGRMNRFDGARQGFGVWAIGLIIALLLSIAGGVFAALNAERLAQQLNLPNFTLDPSTVTLGGVVMLVLTLIVTLLTAIIGGKVGENFHRKVDRAGTVETETTRSGTYREVETDATDRDTRDTKQ